MSFLKCENYRQFLLCPSDRVGSKMAQKLVPDRVRGYDAGPPFRKQAPSCLPLGKQGAGEGTTSSLTPGCGLFCTMMAVNGHERRRVGAHETRHSNGKRKVPLFVPEQGQGKHVRETGGLTMALLAAVVLGCNCGALAFVVPSGGLLNTGISWRPSLLRGSQHAAIGDRMGRIAVGNLRMGKIGGGSGWSRSVPDKGSDTPSRGQSQALARPAPKGLGRWHEGIPLEELSTLKNGLKRKWLSVFDFDGTLFRTPIRFMEHGTPDPPNAGIKPPMVPPVANAQWFDNEICEVVKQRMDSEDHTTVLLSERPGSLKGRVSDLLEQQGLFFDQVVLRPDGKQSMPHSQFKAKWVRNFLKRLRLSQGMESMAEVWDDCPSCRYDCGRIDGVVVHAVLGRYGPPMEVGGNVPGFTPPDSLTYGATAADTSEPPPITYGYALAQGRRDYMEDRAVARKIQAANGATGHFFAIFDGHGGPYAADWACEHLWKHLEERLVKGMEAEEALSEAFLHTDATWCEYAKTDAMMDDDSGSTSLVGLVLGNQVFFASAGDGAGVVYRSGGDAQQVSFAHKPDDPGELRRIQRLGGFVSKGGGGDCARLQGVLAVSRGFGDLSLKQWVTAEPAVLRYDVKEEDRFLVISSDGMTDVLLTSEVGPIVLGAANVEAAAQELVDVAMAEGTTDNVGVMVIDLTGISRSLPHSQALVEDARGSDLVAPGRAVLRSPSAAASSVQSFSRDAAIDVDDGLVGSGGNAGKM